MRLLSIHNIGHDAGTAIFEDGKLLFAVEAERLTRRRFEHDVTSALDHALEETALTISDFDYVVVSAPVRQDILQIDNYEHCLAELRSGKFSVETQCTVREECKPCILVAHEVAHAAGAIHHGRDVSNNALVLVNEGRGLWGRSSLFRFTKGGLTLLAVDPLNWYATGFGWSALGAVLGFGKSPGIAGHLMAIAAFEEPAANLSDAIQSIQNSVLDSAQDAKGAQSIIEAHPEFGRDFNSAARLLASLQHCFTQNIVQECTAQASSQGTDTFFFSGGCGLNIITNSAMRKAGFSLSIPPNCNDSGQALGAGLYVIQFHFKQLPHSFKTAANGREPREAEVTRAIGRLGLNSEEATPEKVGELLANGKIIGICKGVSDLGPRSLGNRSIISRADVPGRADFISRYLKRREWYRPVCASFSEAAFRSVWPKEDISPNMMFSHNLPENIAPECRHVDASCRAHTVTSNENPWFYATLQHFETVTGSLGVINTSLNSAGKAIAYSPDDVLTDFSLRSLDALVLGNLLAHLD